MRAPLVVCRTIVAAVAYLAAASPALAGPCSNDDFVVDGTRVGVELCNAPAPAGAPHRAGGALRVVVVAHGRRLPVQSIAYDRATSSDVARTIGDVSLVSLGIARTLHLTISVRDDDVRIEHALVVPGAIVLK